MIKYATEPRTSASDEIATHNLISAFPEQYVAKVDCLIVIPGLTDERFERMRKLVEENFNITTVLIAGRHADEEHGFIIRNLDELLEAFPSLKKALDRGVEFYFQGTAGNAKEQVDWAAGMCVEFEITWAAITTSWWHLGRAYLCMLAALKQRNMLDSFMLIPNTVWEWPDRFIEETGHTVIEHGPGEYRRVPQYQDKGDLATFDELLDYMARLRVMLAT